MAKAKARKTKEEHAELYPINIAEVQKFLSTLGEKEKDKKVQEKIDCLKWIFKNIYGHVLVCKAKKPLKPGDGRPCCGMC